MTSALIMRLVLLIAELTRSLVKYISLYHLPCVNLHMTKKTWNKEKQSEHFFTSVSNQLIIPNIVPWFDYSWLSYCDQQID